MSKKQHENSWHKDDDDVYLGKEGKELIYIGGPYYDDSAQIHLNVEQARWLRTKLNRLLPKKRKGGSR